MSMTDKDDDMELELYFRAARTTSPDPSDDLMARVLSDAALVQAFAPGIVVTPPEPEAATSLWRQFLNAIGGWSGMAGLCTATVAGLWIGISPPVALQGLGTALTTENNVESAAYLLDMDSYTMALWEEESVE